jgi:hypothetical protein
LKDNAGGATRVKAMKEPLDGQVQTGKLSKLFVACVPLMIFRFRLAFVSGLSFATKKHRTKRLTDFEYGRASSQKTFNRRCRHRCPCRLTIHTTLF